MPDPLVEANGLSDAKPGSAWALFDWVYWPSMLGYLWFWKVEHIEAYGNLLLFWQWVMVALLVGVLALVLAAGRPIALPRPSRGVRRFALEASAYGFLVACVCLGEFALEVAVVIQFVTGAAIRVLSTE